MGCASMLPQNISHLVSPVHALNPSNDEYNWSRFIDHWIDITKLMKTSLELLFPSATVTKQLLLDGRYATLLQHFEPSLRMWHDKFISIKGQFFSISNFPLAFTCSTELSNFLNNMFVDLMIRFACYYGMRSIYGVSLCEVLYEFTCYTSCGRKGNRSRYW